MKAKFELQGLHKVILVLTPEIAEERMLLAEWMRFDANAFAISVDRFENGYIERVRVIADDAR